MNEHNMNVRLSEAARAISDHLHAQELYLGTWYFAGGAASSIALAGLLGEDGPAFGDVDLWVPVEERGMADHRERALRNAGFSINWFDGEYPSKTGTYFSARKGRLNVIVYEDDMLAAPIDLFDLGHLQVCVSNQGLISHTDRFWYSVGQREIHNWDEDWNLRRLAKYVTRLNWPLGEWSAACMYNSIAEEPA